MKKFYAILCLAIASLTQLQAQAPQGFNYQATVRNSSGDLIINTNVYFKFNVIQGSQTAVPIFTETHYVPTDDLGQVNLVIGQGTPSVGTFSELDWSQGSYYLGIELDTGSGYVAMGTTQLLSVPYALYAESSGNSTPTTPNLEAVLAENNSANNQQIKDLQDPTDAQDAVTKAYIDAQIAEAVAGLQNQIDDLIRLDFSTAFTFESSFIETRGATGMVGSSADNSLFIAWRETPAERILKVNLATNNITEKLFDLGQYVTKRPYIRGNQLIVFGGQFVNTYNLDLSGGDPTSVSHGKVLTRFGMTVLNDNAYIIGGDFGAEAEVEAKKIFRWNIENETFSEFTSLPETIFLSGGTIVNDNLYVFGGCSDWLDTRTASTTAYKININNPSNVETFEIDQAIDVAFVRRFQNLIYIAGQTSTIDENDEIIAVNPIIAVYNTSDDTYQELNTNLINTSGFDTIHQMCIVNGKIYIIYGGPDNGGQWEVLVSDLP